MAKSSIKNNGAFILAVILIIAAGLRLYGLSRGDTINDEVLYGFRAIGMMDFDEAADQTTPLEWFDGHIPWWTSLSFHDHPPLVFLIEHLSIGLFGENNFGLRFASALFGVGAIYFLYRVGWLLYSQETGLIAAGIAAVTLNHVYVSRLGIQESYVIFFLLLCSYLFLRALKSDNYFIWLGLALGLSLLTKYTSGVLIPIFVLNVFIFKREYFLNKKLWAGIALMVCVASPIIIYNIELYRATGHFDFQISALGKQPDIWKIQPGKEIGTLGQRAVRFIPTLINTNSWLLLIVFSLSGIGFIISLVRTRSQLFKRHAFVTSAICCTTVFLFIVGPSFRFLTMLAPWTILASASLLAYIYEKKRTAAYIFFILGFLFEIAYSTNSVIAYYPKGHEIWAWSKVREENYNWGYNELGDFIASLFAGKRPEVEFTQRYKFLETLHAKINTSYARGKLAPAKIIVIYDTNVNSLAQLWILDRWQIYHGWPVLRTEDYLSYLTSNGFRSPSQDGFKDHYFIAPSDNIPQKRLEKRTGVGNAFEKELIANGIVPITIPNPRKEPAFRVYKF